MNKIVIITRFTILILIGYAVYGFFVLLIFSYFNQSPHQEKHLSSLNFLLPWSITLILIIFGTIELFFKHKNIKAISGIFVIGLCLELISIKWQLNFLSWSITKNNINEIFLISIALLVIVFFFIKLTINALEIRKKNNTAHNKPAKPQAGAVG
jgi:hypothetical protein